MPKSKKIVSEKISQQEVKISRNQSAATAIEYALIGGLISVAIILGVGYFSEQTNVMYSKITSAISSADSTH